MTTYFLLLPAITIVGQLGVILVVEQLFLLGYDEEHRRLDSCSIVNGRIARETRELELR